MYECVERRWTLGLEVRDGRCTVTNPKATKQNRAGQWSALEGETREERT